MIENDRNEKLILFLESVRKQLTEKLIVKTLQCNVSAKNGNLLFYRYLSLFTLHFSLFTLFISSPAFAETEFRGYYKNIIRSDENNLLTSNRLRLRFLVSFSEFIKGDIEYTNQLSFGKYTNISLGTFNKPFFDIDRVLIQGNNLNWEHSFYRAYITAIFSNMDITIGRQRVAWGTGRFWNPTDLLNPYNPLDIEGGERSGVDALHMRINLSRMSYLSLVAAPNKNEIFDSSIAAKYHVTSGDNDISLITGRFHSDYVIGADFAGSFMGAGIRAESTYTVPQNGNSYPKLVLSADYSIPRIYFLCEYYYNGQGKSDKLLYDVGKLLTGEMMNLAKNYLGFLVTFQATPLLTVSFQTIFNIDDKSFFLAPGFSYSVSSNTELVAGINRFQGENKTEYGRNSTLYYSQFQWSF